MALYLAIFLTASGLAWSTVSARRSRHLSYVFALFLVLFAGTRYFVGCDYTGYEIRFEFLYQSETWLSLLAQPEAGFHLVNFAIIQLGLGYSDLLLVCSAIYLACLVHFAGLARRPLLVLALLFPVLVLQLGMSGLRQALALGFLLVSLRAFVDGKRLHVAAWVFLAFQFHTSAIIFLPLALMAGKAVSTTRILIALALLGPLAGVLMGERFDLYQARYIDQTFGENSSSGAWYRYALALIPFLGFEWKKNMIARRYPAQYPLLRLFSLITLALPLAGLLSSIALHRLGFYVLPVSILVMVHLSESAFRRDNLPFSTALPIIAYTLYMLVWFSFSRHASSCYVPYQSWLF